jgi:hypothetical protein
MQPLKKGTKVYTRLQSGTGQEITVRKRKGVFTLYRENQEVEQFESQTKAMEAADRMATALPPRQHAQT